MPRMFPSPRACRSFAPVALVIVALTMFPMARATAATLTIVTKTLPAGYVKSTYSQSLKATGGSGAGYSWSVISGTLPKGIALTATTGLLHGTPTAASTTTLTFQVKDSAGHTASAKLALTIHPALAITTKSLSTGYVSSAYSATLAATGGTSSGYLWSVQTGSLPAGITLSAAGVLSGKPTVAGSFAVTYQVKDSLSHVAVAPLTIVVKPALAITTKTLPIGYISVAYSSTLAATGGTATGYVWSIKTGALPTGVTLSAAGVLSGKPTVAASFAVTLQVKDSLAHAAVAAFTIVVKPALVIKTPTVAEAYIGTAYSLALTATGGSGTGYTWLLASGTLPSGLALSTTGTISGKPTLAGSSALSIEVKDSAGNTAKVSFTLVVGPQLVITTAGPLPVGYVDTNYNFTFAASGGSGTGYTWTTKSVLPGSFGFTKAGVLYGLTPTADTVILTVVVTDSAKNTASAQYTLIINAAVAQCTNDNQASALSELHGVYTFSLNRHNLTTGQLSYSIGSFDANGPGTISSGVMDSNGPEFAAATQSTFTGTYTVGSDGRGRMDLTFPASGPSTLKQSFCFALDSFAVTKNPNPPPPTLYGAAAHAFVIEDDTSNFTSSGELFIQMVDPANSIMQGSWSFGMTGRAHYPTLIPNGPDPRFAFAGYVNFDGLGTITGGEMDEVISDAINGKLVTPTYRPNQSLAGTYSIPTPSTGTPTGRGTMSVTHNGVTFAQFVFYPYGGATASPTGVQNLAAGLVVLETSVPITSTTPVHVAWAGTGARRSSTTFSATYLNGWSVASQSFVDNPGTTNESEGVGIDVDHWDGAGNFTYTGDRNSASLPSTVSGKGTYTVDANGRFAVMVNGLCAPCGYLTGGNRGFGIYDSENVNFVLLEKQTPPVLGGPFQISSILGAYSFGNRGYAFSQQQTATGETVTRGDANFAGTVDTNTMGKTEVDITQTALETATSTSGATGRFLYQPSNTTFPYAIYVIDPSNAVAIPLGGLGSETDPLLRFIHQ